MSGAIECVLPAGAILGECPLWSGVEQRLYWVDIDGKAVHRFDPESRRDEWRDLPGRPGSLAVTATPGRLLVAMEHELVWLDWASRRVEPWLDLEPPRPGVRLNDGRTDPAGRFWVGSMYAPTSAGRFDGMLHRVEPGGEFTTTRSGIGVANGLAFSPDGSAMYFADTLRDTVWVADYDMASGEASNQRVLMDFAGMPGRPDGAGVDETGAYWIACVGGWAIARITPLGVVDRIIPVPVAWPTMVAFGGPDLRTLFITSIGIREGAATVDDQQDPGGLFALDPGVAGIPEPVFGGRGTFQQG